MTDVKSCGIKKGNAHLNVNNYVLCDYYEKSDSEEIYITTNMIVFM